MMPFACSASTMSRMEATEARLLDILAARDGSSGQLCKNSSPCLHVKCRLVRFPGYMGACTAPTMTRAIGFNKVRCFIGTRMILKTASTLARGEAERGCTMRKISIKDTSSCAHLVTSTVYELNVSVSPSRVTAAY